MSTTLDRLRRLQGLREKRTTAEPDLPQPRFEPTHIDVESQPARGFSTVLPLGVEVENDGGICYVATTAYPLSQQRGEQTLDTLLALSPSTFDKFHPAFNVDALDTYHRAVFLDTETTGLGSGAGVYCFMVGVGSFERLQDVTVDEKDAGTEPEHSASPHVPIHPLGLSAKPTHFVVRQFFMRNPAEERSLLIALQEYLNEFEMTVTFNGRTFDLPLLRTRYSLNRRFLPRNHAMPALLDENKPHLDLLHPARRVWRKRLQSCRLINLEQKILALTRAEHDVPGHMIPLLYNDYVRSGNTSEMQRVFYHNVEDIVSMVAIAERLGRIFHRRPASSAQTPKGHPVDESVPPVQHGLDWLALGQCYEKIDQPEHAESAYRQALDRIHRPSERAEAFARLGQLLKGQARWNEASETWQLWLTSVPGNDPTPYIELAKYCEWQTYDLEQAEMWTAWALHNLQQTGKGGKRHSQSMLSHIDELEHRLQRLRRKSATDTSDPG